MVLIKIFKSYTSIYISPCRWHDPPPTLWTNLKSFYPKMLYVLIEIKWANLSLQIRLDQRFKSFLILPKLINESNIRSDIIYWCLGNGRFSVTFILFNNHCINPCWAASDDISGRYSSKFSIIAERNESKLLWKFPSL